ncbi:MAG: cytochrome d ubiquinol oxidase subunit II [Acidobacteria bacterium]|nr:cytochrome d ubiquinol oxidase subunit II [Acidobacteriota bacterium]MBP7475112.1 cytochrome d ubiquinol oxidase subunit II [Pyrinomonadaceae bacterium]MBP9109002.1 cytochrome d ubiquinol oxidase subunit II [Pyrinomonadaceae bacterium]
METVWFAIIAFMLVCYVVLDGFDIGAGIVQHFVGRSDKEREVVIRAIGPVWDGNEVWLLATGGTLYFAFPALYSAAFSGFYLPLIMVLWLLIMRAAGIELRHQLDNPMWTKFWDFVFSLSSILLAIFFGAALGNVVRGVPLDSTGYFFEPLFTDWGTTGATGILDWFTVLSGVVAFVALAIHGANYLAHKTEGEMNARARKIVSVAWFALVLVTLASLAAVLNVRPTILDNYYFLPIGWLIPVGVIASLAAIKYFNIKGDDKKAFLASSVYLAMMLGGAVYGLYPNVLPALDPQYSLTVQNAKAGAYGLSVGVIWWSIGIVIAIGYFTFLFRTFKGKVVVGEDH